MFYEHSFFLILSLKLSKYACDVSFEKEREIQDSLEVRKITTNVCVFTRLPFCVDLRAKLIGGC